MLEIPRKGGIVMKTCNPNTNRILSRLCWVTAAIYVAIYVAAFWDLPINISIWHQGLLIYFHFIPMFLLQLVLCRTRSTPVSIFLPLGILAGVGLVWLCLTQWTLLGLVLFGYWCIAPVMGCFVAWIVYFAGYILGYRRA